MPGTLFVVATPIGNLEDITMRALRVLREVSVIAAEDTRRTSHLLARYAITTPTTSLHEHNEATKAPELIARLMRGDNVAVVSDAGTPAISDPGRLLVAQAVAAGIRVEPVPGPSAVMAALAVSGLPGDSFAFLGFPPTRPSERKQWFDQVRLSGRVVVFFEAPHRIRQTLEQLHRTIGDRPAVVCREITKAHEELVRGPITRCLEALVEPIGEFTVVVDVGQQTNNEPVAAPADEIMLKEFGDMTKTHGYPRRKVVTLLARRYSLPPNEVYAAIERAKKAGE